MPHPARCGPAGWSYPHWNGVVYPRPKPRAFHPLEFLARYFDTIEINTSFYQPLRPEITRLWLKQVASNPNFVFTAKLNRRFTHDRVLEPADVARFKEGLWPLMHAGRFGCLLMQFPWSFRFTAENRDFFVRLRRAFHEFPLAAEMRHSSWMLDEAQGVFIDHRVAFCNIDLPRHTRAMPPTALVTSPVGYVRLHGRSPAALLRDAGIAGQGTPAFLYPPQDLENWVGRIEHLRAHCSATYVITNNDAAGAAVVNALQLATMLSSSRVEAPPDLLRLYPNELAAFSATRPVQSGLFWYGSTVPAEAERMAG